MTDPSITQTIKINSKPYSTTTYYGGSLDMNGLEYDFTIAYIQDEQTEAYPIVTWVDYPLLDDKDILEIEKEIEDTFEVMIEDNDGD